MLIYLFNEVYPILSIIIKSLKMKMNLMTLILLVEKNIFMMTSIIYSNIIYKDV